MTIKDSPARQLLEQVEEQRDQVYRLRCDVQKLQNRCAGGVSSLGGGSGRNMGPQEHWAALSDLRSQLISRERQLRQLEERVEAWINQIRRPHWRMVLRRRYLDGLGLQELREQLQTSTGREFSMSKIYRLHRQALEEADRIWPLQ